MPGMPATPTASIVPQGDHAKQDTCPPPRAGIQAAHVLPSRPGLSMGVPDGPGGSSSVLLESPHLQRTSVDVPQYYATTTSDCQRVGCCRAPCKAGNTRLQLVGKHKAWLWCLTGSVGGLEGRRGGDVHAILMVGGGQQRRGVVPCEEGALQQLR